jgi:hypothetical protein
MPEDARGAAGGMSGTRNARAPEIVQQRPTHNIAPRARAAEELSYRPPAHDTTRAAREADDPRRQSPPPPRAPAHSERASDAPRRAAPAAPRRSRESEELHYEFEAPRAAHDADNARRSEGRRHPSQPGTSASREPGGRRYPSQPGAAADSGALELYCEIDGATVAIEPNDLSAAGLFVPTSMPPALDSEVAVCLRIAGGRYEACGCVVQSVSSEAARRERRRAGFGLLFTHIEDEVRGRLRDAIDALRSERTERLRGSGTSSDRPAVEPPSTPTTDPKERELLELLRAQLAEVQAQPAWTVLGISQGADPARAREAFFAASKRYHPHVYARYALPEIKDVVTQLFIAYKRAFTSMTKTGPKQRNARPGSRAAVSGNPPGRSSDPGNK